MPGGVADRHHRGTAVLRSQDRRRIHPMSSAPLLFDASHTSHTSAQTGIQRVVRALFTELDARHEVAPVCYDPHLEGWRGLGAGERAVLTDRTGGAGKSRGAKWSLGQKL